VCAASEPDAVHGGLAATRKFANVIEFQVRPFCAPAPLFAHERALAVIALPDGAPDMRRDVARDPALAGPLQRARRLRESIPLQLLRESVQCSIEHGREISSGHPMTEKFLHVAELLAGALVDGRLEREARG
jgi:hypothetical protein